MSEETKNNPTPAGSEPTAARLHLPIWILVLMLVLLYVGGIYFDDHSGWFNKEVYSPYKSAVMLDSYQPKSGAAAMLAQGKRTYDSVCGTCHGNDGEGKPNQAPPLAGSEWVNTRGHTRLAHIPLMGVTGPITVEGKEWNLSMPAMGAGLSNDDLAAVLSYIRGSWGNKAAEVTPDDIKQIRATLKGGPQMMTHEQLMAVPE